MAERYIPDFAIRLDGEPMSAAQRGSVVSLSHTAGLNLASRVDLSLANEGLRWLDEPSLGLDTRLGLSLGYASEGLADVFEGLIVGQTPSFPSGGLPTLGISAQDRMTRLQGGSKSRAFGIPISGTTTIPLPDLAVASIVAAENLLLPGFDPVGAAISVLLTGAEAVASMDPEGIKGLQWIVRKQQAESDMVFLGRLAAENGWEMMIDHSGPLAGHQLRFFSPLGKLTPDLTLKYGESLVEFTPRLSNVGLISSVTTIIWISAIKMKFSVTVGWDWDRACLSIKIMPALTIISVDEGEVIDEPVTPESAPRKILSTLIPKLNQRLTGTGSTLGNLDLKPGGVLKLEGLGKEFSGYYRVTSVTHSLDGGGFKTKFEVRKEIWFAGIPLPEQGSVPISLSL